MHGRVRLALVGFGFLLMALPCWAESQDRTQYPVLNVPLASQRAVVTQTIGTTDITLSYHRPLVHGRKVWGGIVPYGSVWRAGANENTTIEFGDGVMVEGKELPKGIYGLHMIPGENEWTVIFSKNSGSWGSFSYDQKEDALRVVVKPSPSEFREALTYDFEELKPDSSAITLRWEKLAVPFRVTVPVREIVERSFPQQLKGVAQYSWGPWNSAATYLVDNKGNLQDALRYANQSIQVEERFENLLTKSRVLAASGRKDEAVATKAKAMEKASAVQAHLYARTLLIQGKDRDEALKILRENARKHPDQWFVHGGMARVHSAEGHFDKAVKEMKIALSNAPQDQKSSVEQLIKRLEAKEDINKT